MEQAYDRSFYEKYIYGRRELLAKWTAENRTRIRNAIGPGPIKMLSDQKLTLMRMFYEETNN